MYIQVFTKWLHCRIVGIVLTGAIAALGQPVLGQCILDSQLSTTLEPNFGGSVAISGNNAIVGASDAGQPFNFYGEAYLYSFDGTNWTIEQTLSGSDTNDSDYFGTSVSIDGDVAVVGAPNAAGLILDWGAAYVFRFNGTQWVEEQKLLPSDINFAGTDYGQSVAVHGDMIVVGVPDSSVSYVYRYNGSTWVEEAILHPWDTGSGIDFGRSVDVVDNVYDGRSYVCVGAPANDNANGVDAGAIYVYLRNAGGSTWLNHIKLLPGENTAGLQYGWSVACDEDSAFFTVVGGVRNGQGAVFVSTDDLLVGFADWQTPIKLVAPDGEPSEVFGRSVAMCHNMLVVGAYLDDDAGAGAGSAYVWRRFYQYPNESWVLLSKVLPAAGTVNGNFGGDVACHEGRVFYGAPGQRRVYFDIDCDGNFFPDCADVAGNWVMDCNENGVPDECDLASGISLDCNFDDIPDECVLLAYDSNIDVPIDIADGTGTFISDSISIAESATITDLNVRVEIDHTWNGDLTVRLTHGAVTVVLIDRPGVPPDTFGFGDDGYDIVLDDEGAGGPVESFTTNGPTVTSPPAFIPNEALSAFDGMDMSGTWVLEVSDSALQDVGALVSWELDVDLGDCNGNGIPDSCDIANGASDCDGDGRPDSCDIALGAPDCNSNGVVDTCEYPGTCELQKLTQAGPFARFGSSVQVSGEVAIVGAPELSPGGAAYIFRQNQATGLWQQEQVLTEVAPLGDDYYGIEVAIDGDVAAVAVPNFDAMGENSGSVYVYRFNGSVWSLDQQLFASDAVEFSIFGGSVDVRGDTIIVGAWGNIDSTGAAYIYQYNAKTQTWDEQVKLTASDAATESVFGWSVSLGYRCAVVGARGFDSVSTDNVGAVYVFVYDDLFETWTEYDKLTADDGEQTDLFGSSVAVTRNELGFPRYIAVGAPWVDSDELSTGAVYFYEWRAGGITFNGKHIVEGLSGSSQLGLSVAIDGMTCVAGAPFRNVQGFNNAGSAFVFHRTGTGVGDPWEQQMELIPGDLTSSMGYGSGIGLSGSHVLVGAALENTLAGATYVVGGMGDCNNNGIVDCADIFCETSSDLDGNAVPDECAPPCPEDIVTSATFQPPPDGIVDGADLAYLLGEWGANPGSPADIVDSNTFAPPPDGVVDGADLAILLGAWGACD